MLANCAPKKGAAPMIWVRGVCRARVQNSRMFLRRFSGGLPAISAALIAPMEVPITQSGSIPASCRA